MEKVIIIFAATLTAANAGLLNHQLRRTYTSADFQTEVHREPEQYREPASYQFNYAVEDASHGNYQSQSERRTGHRVDGSYSVIEPDGQRRIVEYSSDKDLGFTAQVIREPSHYQQFTPHLPLQNTYLPPSSSPLPIPPQLPDHPLVPPPPASEVPPASHPPALPPTGDLPYPLPPVAPSPPFPSPPLLPPIYGPPPAGDLPSIPKPPVQPTPPVLPPVVYGPPSATRLPFVPKINFPRYGLSYSYFSSPHSTHLTYY